MACFLRWALLLRCPLPPSSHAGGVETKASMSRNCVFFPRHSAGQVLELSLLLLVLWRGAVCHSTTSLASNVGFINSLQGGIPISHSSSASPRLHKFTLGWDPNTLSLHIIQNWNMVYAAGLWTKSVLVFIELSFFVLSASSNYLSKSSDLETCTFLNKYTVIL